MNVFSIPMLSDITTNIISIVEIYTMEVLNIILYICIYYYFVTIIIMLLVFLFIIFLLYIFFLLSVFNNNFIRIILQKKVTNEIGKRKTDEKSKYNGIQDKRQGKKKEKIHL